ncbi:hypothetical protein A3F66_04130 [candidate division TM6 bacterium RIFCSPHIGHO2_12_FULL_32_22]|nr:MAG: hypothetical protein A3F66_04130 [candidate division TM6 bacterium RIFCSPHIGHO2_12_FULL_32_22]
MSHSSKLSLSQAILINVNIMLGAGIFINTIPLAKSAGALSPLVYLLVGLLMLPLILSVSKLLKYYPGGSFYTYGTSSLNSFWGFLSSWSYFTGKLASSTLMIHFCIKILQALIPQLAFINIFLLDASVIITFTLLNLLNLKTGSRIQYSFMFFKLIPILFVILTGIFIFNGTAFTTNLKWDGLTLAIPLVIYAFSGFEACCSLSRHIENPEKNAPIAVIVSFLIVVCLVTLYQLFFYTSTSEAISNAVDYSQALPLLVNKLNFNNLAIYIQNIFQIAISLSALGGAYGILFSNNWNLFILAEHKHVFFSDIFKTLNKNNIPIFCVITEAIFCIFYLILSKGNNIILQQIAAFGCILSYTISVLSLVALKSDKLLSFLALGSCLILIVFSIRSFLNTDYLPFFVFLAILGTGAVMFFINRKRSL